MPKNYTIDATLLDRLVCSLSSEAAGEVLAVWAQTITSAPRFGADESPESIEDFMHEVHIDAEITKTKAKITSQRRRAAVNRRWGYDQHQPAKPPAQPAPIPDADSVNETYRLLVQSAPLLEGCKEPLMRWLTVVDAKYGRQPYLSIEGCVRQGLQLAKGDLAQFTEILNQAANGGWRQLYPLKKQNQNGKQQPTDYANAVNYNAIAAGVAHGNNKD